LTLYKTIIILFHHEMLEKIVKRMHRSHRR